MKIFKNSKIAGDAADITEEVSDEIITKRAILILKEIFGNKEVTFKKLRDFRVTKWRKNPFVQGAYSYIAVGASGDGKLFECINLNPNAVGIFNFK